VFWETVSADAVPLMLIPGSSSIRYKILSSKSEYSMTAAFLDLLGATNSSVSDATMNHANILESCGRETVPEKGVLLSY
jgi:hypothetical protein